MPQLKGEDRDGDGDRDRDVESHKDGVEPVAKVMVGVRASTKYEMS